MPPVKPGVTGPQGAADSRTEALGQGVFQAFLPAYPDADADEGNRRSPRPEALAAREIQAFRYASAGDSAA